MRRWDWSGSPRTAATEKICRLNQPSEEGD
jgi:hypothetical protein